MGIAINSLKTKLVWGNISDYLTGSTGFRRVVLALFDGKGFDVLKKKLTSLDLP
ncbi:MAG: hypothetical protein QF504_05390 [Nitrospinaceae bacterium]|nr:hypothetical protein [Nitrospinaceae bacterium]